MRIFTIIPFHDHVSTVLDYRVILQSNCSIPAVVAVVKWQVRVDIVQSN